MHMVVMRFAIRLRPNGRSGYGLVALNDMTWVFDRLCFFVHIAAVVALCSPDAWAFLGWRALKDTTRKAALGGLLQHLQHSPFQIGQSNVAEPLYTIFFCL
jgi:hypothetical protein